MKRKILEYSAIIAMIGSSVLIGKAMFETKNEWVLLLYVIACLSTCSTIDSIALKRKEKLKAKERTTAKERFWEYRFLWWIASTFIFVSIVVATKFLYMWWFIFQTV